MPYSEYEFFGFKTAPKNLDDPIDEITDSDYLDETVVTNPHQTQGENHARSENNHA